MTTSLYIASCSLFCDYKKDRDNGKGWTERKERKEMTEREREREMEDESGERQQKEDKRANKNTKTGEKR